MVTIDYNVLGQSNFDDSYGFTNGFGLMLESGLNRNITMSAKGSLLSGEVKHMGFTNLKETSKNFEAATDLAVESLRRQLKKYKEKQKVYS